MRKLIAQIIMSCGLLAAVVAIAGLNVFSIFSAPQYGRSRHRITPISRGL
jgi:hypothetical protein